MIRIILIIINQEEQFSLLIDKYNETINITKTCKQKLKKNPNSTTFLVKKECSQWKYKSFRSIKWTDLELTLLRCKG